MPMMKSVMAGVLNFIKPSSLEWIFRLEFNGGHFLQKTKQKQREDKKGYSLVWLGIEILVFYFQFFFSVATTAIPRYLHGQVVGFVFFLNCSG